MIKINDLIQDRKETITFAKFKKELNNLLKDSGYKFSSFEKALSGSKYICITKTDAYDEINFIRVANHHKSFQDEGWVSVITNESKVYAEIIAYLIKMIKEEELIERLKDY